MHKLSTSLGNTSGGESRKLVTAAYKDFTAQMQRLGSRGGTQRQIAQKAANILFVAQTEGRTGLARFATTHHGESRLKHCVKYDLGDGYRLVTVQTDGVAFFCFVGSHDETDRWLATNRNQRFVVDRINQLECVRVTEREATPKIVEDRDSDYAEGRLVERIRPTSLDTLLTGLPPSAVLAVGGLTTSSTDAELEAAVACIADSSQASAMLDVLLSLREGNVHEAERRLDLYSGRLRLVDQLPPAELVELRDGATVKLVPVDSVEYQQWIARLMSAPSFEEWMLFTHPEQQRIVDATFDGPAMLSGVSGSGKTSILVKRAVKLAGDAPDASILVVTLNRSLAALIGKLADYAANGDPLRHRIKVCALFDLCFELLKELEPGNPKIFRDVTWKNDEHIDEIWREFYRCHANNQDAAPLLALQKQLNARGVSGERYLREEMDWIRSALEPQRRKEYRNVERRGRAIPLQTVMRDLVLNGLQCWERKMEDVGVTDHLGLATRLVPYLGSLTPRYTHALVDEVQDFGTMELRVVRALVAEGPNDLLLCGDLAQRVQIKHASLRDAGVHLAPERSRSIRRNYRNGREVLRAAHHVLTRAVGSLDQVEGEVEWLDPEYSNFSVPRPLIMQADDLREEITAALHLADAEAETGRRTCVAFAGYSLRDIQAYGVRSGRLVLDGTRGLEEGRVFLSDLEQTKGYEFDNMVIVNARDGVVPAADLPLEEQYREACRLYVAMTRTKKQLLVSYSGTLSSWLSGLEEMVHYERWREHVAVGSAPLAAEPERMPETEIPTDHAEMTGRQALYTPNAIGLSLELQEKLDELVAGVSARDTNGRPRRWKSLAAAVRDVSKEPHAKQLFGLKVHKELLERFGFLL